MEKQTKKLETFQIFYTKDDVGCSIRIKAQNRGIARAEFKKQFPDIKISSMSLAQTPEIIALKEAIATGPIRVGVQKSLNLGFGDLPLFQEDNQLKLF